MKRWISLLLFFCMLLPGCSGKADTGQREQAATSFLVGTWQSVTDDAQVIFQEDGACRIRTPEREETGTYKPDGDTVHITWGDMKVDSFRGVRCLIHPGWMDAYGKERIYVSAEDYGKVAPEEIPITLENWDTYFEIRQLRHVFGSGTDGYMSIFILGVCLKHEYLDRLWKDPTDITFTVCRDVYHCDIEDPLGEPMVSNMMLTKQGLTTSARVLDWRDMPENHPLDETDDFYCAIINSGYAVWENHIYIEKDGQVTEVRGSLWLYPAGEN